MFEPHAAAFSRKRAAVAFQKLHPSIKQHHGLYHTNTPSPPSILQPRASEHSQGPTQLELDQPGSQTSGFQVRQGRWCHM